MSVLSVLSGLSTAAGKGYAGYGEDQQLRVKNALAQSEDAREAERNRVLNLMTQRQVATPILGEPEYAAGRAAVAGAEAAARVGPAVETAKAVAPIQQQTHGANRDYDIANPLPVQQSYSPVTLGGENGQPAVVKPFDNKTGKVGEAIGEAKPTAGATSTGGAAMKKALAANVSQLAVIDDAMKELDAHPGAVGLTRGLPMIGDRLDPRSDPKGVGARASIANIGSLKIHDRSGAAVSVHEFPRLAPFIPSISDPPEAIKIKLGKLREAIQVETDALNAGGKPDSSAGGAPKTPGELWDAAVAKHGQAKVLQTFGPRPPG